MKVAVVFILLFATVLCRPVKKFSSSESSEEVVRRPSAPPLRRKAAEVPQYRAAPVQNAGSDESTETSEEYEQVAAEAPVEVKSVGTDTTSSADTASVDSQDSEDSDDDDDDDAESETEEDDTSESSESGESSTPAPATIAPVIVTEEPVTEAADPIVPSIVTDTARGDSLGGYPSDYKSIIYVEEKSYHKVPAPYKSYEYMGTGKKTAYDMTEGNEVDKSLKVYKVQALQVHSDILEEDTSTPDVESQGLDASSSQDQDAMPRQASLPQEEESASDTTASESSSATEEEEEEESASNDASTSQESEDEDSQSSEEATATPGVTDSESDESTESDSDEEGAGPDSTTDLPVVITAK